MPPFISKLVAHQRLLERLRKLLDVVIASFLASNDPQFDPYHGLFDNVEATSLVQEITNEMETLTGKTSSPEGNRYTQEQIREFIRLKRCMDDIKSFLGPERQGNLESTITSFVKNLLENRVLVE